MGKLSFKTSQGRDSRRQNEGLFTGIADTRSVDTVAVSAALRLFTGRSLYLLQRLIGQLLGLRTVRVLEVLLIRDGLGFDYRHL